MKISYNWLTEFVDLKGITPETVGKKLTLHTAELEELLSQSSFFENIFAGKFIERRDHKDSEKLSVGIFDLGEQGKKQILYGKAHEIAIGDILPIAIETTLKSGIKVTASEIRGEKSDGMIADNPELGLKGDGLLRFTENQMGKNLVEITKEAGDILLDIDNKSLTHRPDLMGHRGFALEFSAIFDRNLTLPEPAVAVPENKKPLAIKIETDRCRRFCGIQLSRVKVTDSDLDTQFRLENLGIRSISNLVDITNLMMMEFGQPMHVFDADKVTGSIIVRQAKSGEELVALDGETYKLTEEDIVIADEEKVLSIAGIMGGLESGVTKDTTSIIFEVANFDPVSIRKTSQRLGLRSESSMRFEKSLDPALCKKVLFSAVESVQGYCPDLTIETAVGDKWPTIFPKKTITLAPQKVRKHSGMNLSDQEIQAKLESIDFQVTLQENGDFLVKVPTNRATKDIALPEDLIEEVVRLHGFTDIISKLPVLPIVPPIRNYKREFEWLVRDFSAGLGFLEVYNYDFVSEKDADFTGKSNYVTIANPLSSEHTHLRQTLLSNGIKGIESELRTHGKVQIFELGKVFEDLGEVLPDERLNLSFLSAQMEGDENALFFELKQRFRQLLKHLTIESAVRFQPSNTDNLKPYMHPSKTADILVGNSVIGQISVLHPQFLPVKKASVVFVEVSLEALLRIHEKTVVCYQKASPYPSVYRDLSIVLSDRILIADIEKSAFEAAPYLQKMVLFDEYQDDQKLGKGLKNLAFHLTFQSDKKTLEESETEANFEAIVKVLQKNLKASLRLDFDKKQTA